MTLWGIGELKLFLAMFAAFVVALEVGYRIGRTYRTAADADTRAHIGTLQAAVLGLLALLLGFTFAMAVSRFDTRRSLVLQEANAISTTYSRARLFSQVQSQQIMGSLRDYVHARLDFYDAGIDVERLDSAQAAASRLESQLWAVTVAAAKEDPRAVSIALFVQALNDMSDIREKRLAAMEDHVPQTVIYLIVTVSIVALALVAYGCGLDQRRRLLSNATFSLLIALVLTTILDIDRPRRGLIKVSQESLIRLKETLEADRVDQAAHRRLSRHGRFASD
jgi:hypothetical protein